MDSVAMQILKRHLVEGNLVPGEPIKIHIDTTLTQDATGTMAYLQLEALGIDRVKTKRSVSYVDHNTLQNGFRNADDAVYLQSVADRYGVYFSRCGNGICHQVNLERFDAPGDTLLGSDSHTPTGGAMGMIAIGAGGLDVACAMAGIPFSMKCPKIVNIQLKGTLKNGVSAKDIILKILQEMTVSGGVDKIMEYSGEALASLSVPERGTICNMGAELGATCSIFPSDEQTRIFLQKQGREEEYQEIKAQPGATYDEVLTINCDELVPMIAQPSQPDQVVTVESLKGKPIDQVCIGSCTNSSFTDLVNVARILKGHTIAPNVSCTISFGSKQVLRMLQQSGDLDAIIASGARLLEATCGPCIGMGQSPKTDAVSLRTFNRNFYGRSGTLSAGIYLVSPETAAASAIAGVLTDPQTVPFEKAELPEKYLVDDSMILAPTCDPSHPIVKGPNITSFPIKEPLTTIQAPVNIVVGDNITTDDIMPAGANVLPYRSNIEKISTFCFSQIDEGFAKRCKESGKGIIVAGENYGQGSSREHAALAPMYLGIQAVLAKSYARIHRKNLVNNGILPCTLTSQEKISQGDVLQFVDLDTLAVGKPLTVLNQTTQKTFQVIPAIEEEEIAIIRCGGYLNSLKQTLNKK